jgi:hypothetical protein
MPNSNDKRAKQSERWWSSIYSAEDLISGVQSLRDEKQYSNLIRAVLLLAHFYNIWMIIDLYYFHRLFQFFTNWTILVNTIYFALAIYASKSKSLSTLAAHHIFFEISFMMNFITMVVFWSVLLNQALKECEGHQGRIFNVYYAHLVPGISALINFIITDVVIRASHVKIILPISAAYGVVNYIEVKSLGRPLYWFLTW